MLNPDSGPFLFDTSAESWLARADASDVRDWMRGYLSQHQVHVSAVTVLERIRGYALLWRSALEDHRRVIEKARLAYLKELGQVLGTRHRRIHGCRRDHGSRAASANTTAANSQTG
jgi:hypothetical protein